MELRTQKVARLASGMDRHGEGLGQDGKNLHAG